MSSRRDSVGSCSSSAAHSMTLSVPPTAVGSRRSSFNATLYEVIPQQEDPMNKVDLLPPHCHEMLSDDSECVVDGDTVEQPMPVIAGRMLPDITTGASSKASSTQTSPAHAAKSAEKQRRIAEKRAEHAKITSRARARSFCAPETEAEAGSALKATFLNGHETLSSSRGRWNSVEGSFFLTVPFSDTATDPVVLMQRAASPPGNPPPELEECPTSIPSGFSKHWVKTYKQFTRGKSRLFGDTTKFKSLENYAHSLDKLRAWSNQIELDRRQASTLVHTSDHGHHQGWRLGILPPPSGKKDFHEKCNPRKSTSRKKTHRNPSNDLPSKSLARGSDSGSQGQPMKRASRPLQHQTSSSSSNTFDGLVPARRRKIPHEASHSARLQQGQIGSQVMRDFWPPWWHEQWGANADFEIACWKKGTARRDVLRQPHGPTSDDDLATEAEVELVYRKCRDWLRRSSVELKRMGSTERSFPDV